MQRNSLRLAALVLLATAAAPGLARGQTILVNNNTTFLNSVSGVLFDSSTPLGLQFTLSSAYTITSVDSTVEAFLGAATGQALLYSDSSNSPGSLLASSSTTSLASNFTNTTFTFSGANLAAGTYWFMLSTTSGSGSALYASTQLPLTGSGATLNNLIYEFGSVTTPDYNNDYPMGVTIRGTPFAAVPEPSSLALGGVSAAFGLGLTWARRKRAGLAA